MAEAFDQSHTQTAGSSMVHWPVKSGAQPKERADPAKASFGALPPKSAPWLEAAAERLEVARAVATEAVGQPPWRAPPTTTGGDTAGSSSSSKAATKPPAKGIGSLKTLGLMREANITASGFSPARHCFMVLGRPVVVRLCTVSYKIEHLLCPIHDGV